MAERERDTNEPQRLSQRIEQHRQEVQFLVKQGGEQPQYEFKRAVALGRENLDDRLDFIKLAQAVANADIPAEHCIVIGADPKEKKFYPVRNEQDLDAANVSKILSAYLEPVPLFRVFNVTTDENEPFVLIVLDANQPRPIVVTRQGHTEKGKTRLEVGDIWVKKNTDTVRATKADLDSIYSVWIEAEAEDRARKRLKHLVEVASAAQPPQTSATAIPTFELLVGPRNALQRFSAELIATGDLRRFRMLLELGRETLIEGSDKLDASAPELFQNSKQLSTEVDDFYRDEQLPALESIVELGLVLVKQDADREWLKDVIELLLEALDASRSLAQLTRGFVNTERSSLPWWRPAFDVYIGIRTIASYAVRRNRLQFLESILPRVVERISPDYRLHGRTPILFWPFGELHFNSGEFNGGRASFYWKDRIAAAWGGYFGSSVKFLESASQLEFLLELNSYLGTNTLRDQKLQHWLPLNVDADFTYVPDLYSQDLQTTVPMAERVYDILASGKSIPAYLTVDPRISSCVFDDLDAFKRLEIYAGFLHHLKEWQSKFRWGAFMRSGFMWDWETPRLKKIVGAFREAQRKKAAVSAPS